MDAAQQRPAPTDPGHAGPAPGALLAVLVHTGHLAVFLLGAARRLRRPGPCLHNLGRELQFIGARSMLVIVVSGGFIGMVVALQFHDTLVRFGSVGLLGSAVGLSLVRELGPVITALMVVARAGSVMAAELGIMRTDHQIDALECMAIDPYRFLVIPKIVATIIALPLLTAIFVGVGILGGYLIGVVGYGVGSGAYFDGMATAVVSGDLLMGLAKAVAFGFVIGWICTAKGFLIHLGPRGLQGVQGVSLTTTAAVVTAALAVLFADYVLSAILV